MIYKTINNAYELKEEFKAYDRDYYSISAYEAILDYFEDCYPDGYELDVIAICCDFIEEKLEDIAICYGLSVNYDGWENDAIAIVEENTWAVETEHNKVLYINY